MEEHAVGVFALTQSAQVGQAPLLPVRWRDRPALRMVTEPAVHRKILPMWMLTIGPTGTHNMYEEYLPASNVGKHHSHPAKRYVPRRAHDIASTQGMYYLVSTKLRIRSCFGSKHLGDGSPSTIDQKARSEFERSTRGTSPMKALSSVVRRYQISGVGVKWARSVLHWNIGYCAKNG